MHRNPKTVATGRLAGEAFGLDDGPPAPTTSLFVVVETGHPTGFIRVRDCLRVGIA